MKTPAGSRPLTPEEVKEQRDVKARPAFAIWNEYLTEEVEKCTGEYIHVVLCRAEIKKRLRTAFGEECKPYWAHIEKQFESQGWTVRLAVGDKIDFTATD